MKIILFMPFYWIMVYSIFGLKYKGRALNYLTSFFILTSLYILMAFKDYSIGIDTYQYIHRYNQINSWKDIYTKTSKEFLFNGISFFSKKIGLSLQGYFLIIYALILFPLHKFFLKNSKNILLSYLLYLSIGSFTMAMSGIRQSISVGIFLLSFEYILKKDLIKYISLIFIGSLIHNSCLILLPLYFMNRIRLTRKKSVYLLIFVLSTYFYKGFVIKKLTKLSGAYGKYNIEEVIKINPLLILMGLFITVAIITFSKKINFNSKRFNLLLCLSLLNLQFLILSDQFIYVNRINFYINASNIVLISNLIESIKVKKVRSAMIILTCLFSMMFFIRIITHSRGNLMNYQFIIQNK